MRFKEKLSIVLTSVSTTAQVLLIQDLFDFYSSTRKIDFVKTGKYLLFCLVRYKLGNCKISYLINISLNYQILTN